MALIAGSGCRIVVAVDTGSGRRILLIAGTRSGIIAAVAMATGGRRGIAVLAPLAIRHIVMGDMAVRPLVDNRDAGRPRLRGKRLALSDAAFPYVPSFQGSLAQCLGVVAPC